jgi:hypothetical protein
MDKDVFVSWNPMEKWTEVDRLSPYVLDKENFLSTPTFDPLPLHILKYSYYTLILQ